MCIPSRLGVGRIVCPECGGDQEAYRKLFPPELGKGGIDPKLLGKRLSRLKGQVHGAHRPIIAKKSDSHGHRWALMNTEPTKAGTTTTGG